MRTSQGTLLEALRSVQQFLAKYATRLAAVVASGSRRQLDQVVTDMSSLADNQAETKLSVKGGVTRAKRLRIDLMQKHMLPIARIAAVDIPVTPELAATFRMPKGNVTPEKLVAAARGMATAATPFAQTFIDAGLPLDFVAQLTASADALAQAAAQLKGKKNAGKAATGGIKSMHSTGIRVVNALDSLIQKELTTGVQADTVILNEWDGVKKSRKAPARPAAPQAPVPIPPATTPVAPASSTPAAA